MSNQQFLALGENRFDWVSKFALVDHQVGFEKIFVSDCTIDYDAKILVAEIDQLIKCNHYHIIGNVPATKPVRWDFYKNKELYM